MVDLALSPKSFIVTDMLMDNSLTLGKKHLKTPFKSLFLEMEKVMTALGPGG